MTCGTLDVPLDYTDPHSSQLLTLDIAKVNATKRPSRRDSEKQEPSSIIFNFGGPGEDSLSSMIDLGDQLQTYG